MTTIYEEKQVTKKVPVKYKCDCCGKEFDSDESLATMTAHHDGWGNDSIESLVSYDYCRSECYFNLLWILLGEFEDYSDTARIDEKPYSMVQGISQRGGEK